jgi:chemotaxis protein MotB
VRLRERLEHSLHDELAAGRLRLVDDRRGLVVEVPEGAVFEPGRADLSHDAQARLRRLGAVLAEVPNPVRVEGHTDDAPIRTSRFQSNWELSTARATEVVALLVRDAAIPADRLSAAGYGEHRPRAGNDDAAGRARNRRVDLVILSAATAAGEEPPVVAGAPR